MASTGQGGGVPAGLQAGMKGACAAALTVMIPASASAHATGQSFVALLPTVTYGDRGRHRRPASLHGSFRSVRLPTCCQAAALRDAARPSFGPPPALAFILSGGISGGRRARPVVASSASGPLWITDGAGTSFDPWDGFRPGAGRCGRAGWPGAPLTLPRRAGVWPAAALLLPFSPSPSSSGAG